MPLQANLRDISPTQVLNLVNLAGKTGMLTIFEGIPSNDQDAMGKPKQLPGAERAKIAFKGGKLIHAHMGEQDGNLVSVLNKAGKLNDSQSRIIRERSQKLGDKALALLLINANYVTQQEIVASIQQHMLDVVYNMLTWVEGPFRFDDGILPASERILVPLDLENVIIEGARRIQENEKLLKELPDLDYSLKFPENPKEKFKNVHLSVEEWRVVSFVNPKNTIRQIARAANMTDMEIRRIIYGLMMAGLVILVRPIGDRNAKPTEQQKTKTPPPRKIKKAQVQESVVNKLIDKIRSL